MKAISRLLAVLAVLLLTGCGEKDHPVRTSLVVDTSTMTLSIGESAVRMATSKAEDAVITYTSSNPAVATVDQFGKVTALTEGETTITITMDETKKSWYAASTIEYQVVVKNVSAKALEDVDKSTPLTLVAGEDGKITVTFNGGITLENDIHYTINGGAEQTIAKNTEGSFDITVKKGDVVQFYSINTSLGGSAVAAARGMTRAVDSGTKYINIKPSMKTEIYGNVMSLLKGKDNFANADAIESNNAFYGLFAGAEKLVNSTERKLVLPATTLKEGCYQDMFNGCKGIEKAPELPAPALVKDCYKEMFAGCAKLNHVACLATDISAEGSTKDWLAKAGTEATSAPVLETLVPMPPGSDGLPETWTAKKIVLVESVDIKPELGLVVGEADVTLTVIVLPEDATDKTVTWTSSNPAVATVNDGGTVHAVAPGEATITATAGDKTATCKVTVTEAPAGWAANDYKEGTWDGTKVVFTKKTAETVIVMTNSTNYWSDEWYTVAGDVSITGDVTLQTDVHLILQDGATLKITGQLNCNSNEKNLYIYGQNEGNGKLNVPCPSGEAIYANSDKHIEIHGGEITATATDNNAEGLNTGYIKVYGGKLTATSTVSHGISFANSFDVYGGVVVATSNAPSDPKDGIKTNNGTLTVYGGKVKGTGSASGYGFNCKLKSGTSGIKFYFAETGDGLATTTGYPFEVATEITSDFQKRYTKAE